MNLKDKITSKEDLTKALLPLGTSPDRVMRSLQAEHGIEPAWWAAREQVRISSMIYETTTALEKVNGHVKVFAHVSSLDRTKVAFTPDKAFGERDAQLAMNFGKFVQRVIPFASDEYVKTLTEEHNSDLTNEVEWISGIEIAEVYADTKVTSCMAGPGRAWDWKNPAIAYAATGIKLAVMRDKDGNINARCLVYEAGEDKRMIRSYGDGALSRRLNRLGYKLGGWQGVKFNTVTKPVSGLTRVVTPYLDSAGGMGSAKHSTVALLDGVLQGLSPEQAMKINRVYTYTKVATSTAGYMDMTPISSADFIETDMITGEAVNTLTQDTSAFIIGNDVGVTLSTNIKDEMREANTYFEGRWVSGRTLSTETFSFRYNIYVDTEINRTSLGFKKLSTKYYDTQTWHFNLAEIYVDNVQHYVKDEDTVNIWDSGRRKVFKTDVTKAHIKLADVDGAKWYAAPGTEILRTPSKAKVVLGLHAIREGWNRLDYARNLNCSTPVFSGRVYYSKPETAKPELAMHIAAKANDWIVSNTDRGWSVQEVFAYACRQAHITRNVYPSRGNQHYTQTLYGTNGLSRLGNEAFKEYLKDFKDYIGSAITDVVARALVAYCQLRIAEMEATNGEEPNQAEQLLNLALTT